MGRSTARPGPSQSQRPSQTQKARGGRRQAEVEDVEEEEEQQEEPDGDEDHGMEQDNGQSELSRKANDLVRLALFVEQRRTVLRREEINKKALGTSSRAFNTIFDLAQHKLRNTFGLELVELPSRAALGQENAGEDDEARAATGMKRRANAVGSKTYILRSCLDPILIERAAQTEEDILEEESKDHTILYPSLNQSDDDSDDSEAEAERPPKYYGSLISWTKSDQLGPIGILYVILALILVNGRAISDTDLRKHLKTLHLPSNPNFNPVHNTATSTTRSMNLDTYLSKLLQQNYIDRQQVGGDGTGKKAKKGGGVKRLRTQAEDMEEGRTYEWRWGTRAFSEVGEEDVARFISEFMVGNEGEGDEEGAGSAAERRRQQALAEKMYAGVQKAAGGKLQELK